MLCTSCVKKAQRTSPGGPSQQRHHQNEGYDDDPYFYGGFYYGAYYYDTYHGSSHGDPHDFTEADAESLAMEGDEGFESDMSES
jgi:hypothetical protein